MQRRTLGKTNLEVSVISLDCGAFGEDNSATRTQEDCNHLCSCAFNHGITFFDTCNSRSEALLGRWRKDADIPREQIQIGSRFGNNGDPASPSGPQPQGFSPQALQAAVEQSLKRLGTDYIDLYLAHHIKLPQFREDLFAECEKLVREGKIRAWGVSLGPAIGWREEGLSAMMDHRAQAVQTVFNLLEQDPGREFCQVARATGAGILARDPDHCGILRNLQSGMAMSADDPHLSADESWRVYSLQKVEKIRHIADNHGMTIHQLACKWLLMEPALTSIIAKLLDEQTIAEVCAVPDLPDLTAAELDEIATGYAQHFGLGEAARPRDLQSSTAPGGTVRSGYVPPPILLA